MLTCPNCGREVAYDGGAEAICAACPGGGPDGDTHFTPSTPETAPDLDASAGDEPEDAAPQGNQPGSERDPAWILPDHGVSFSSQFSSGSEVGNQDGSHRDMSQELPAHGVEGRD